MVEDSDQAKIESDQTSESSKGRRRRESESSKSQDRSSLARFWYRIVQWFFSTLLASLSGLRATGRENIPDQGSVLLVSNHLSHLDVLVLGILLKRPLNYVARSTLFFWPLGPFIRSVGAFPIQRDGIGAQGLKETLRRLRSGGIVTLFPEGTRTSDGQLSELKAGIALLAAKAKVPILPAAIAGSFESWPKYRSLPLPHPIRVHFGILITPEEIRSLGPEALTNLIREQILECQAIARRGLEGDTAATGQ
ncbi:lysophospholipid acyltransferase family protein [Tundrisphaera lichenicola]|uniref:lysophospholipid acyltransferase family protein n=1 Tax=Tundrisphaera lichenicola TaxID=2029860 RepID=UPI003EBFF27D